MRIKWSDESINDLQALQQYVSRDSNTAARSLVKRILGAVSILSEQPGVGRKGRVVNTRELIISGTSYIIPYRVKNEIIEILRVFHSAMQWPEKF